MCLLNAWHARRCIAPIACSWRRIPKFWNWTVPAELLASLIQTAEQALWKREWAARDYGLAVPECVTRRQAVVNQARILLKNNTHENG
ncbi:DUF1380 family protein [Escherichia coli]